MNIGNIAVAKEIKSMDDTELCNLVLMCADKMRTADQAVQFTSQVKQLNQVYSNEGLDTAALECYGYTKEELTKMESSNEVIVAAIIVAAAVALIALITALIVKLFGGKDSKGLTESNEESYKDQVDAYKDLENNQKTAAEKEYDKLYAELEKHEDNKTPSLKFQPLDKGTVEEFEKNNIGRGTD